jgi:hypothetical protein
MVCRKTQISEDFFERPNAGKVFGGGTTKAAPFRESGQQTRQNPSKFQVGGATENEIFQ